MIESLWKIDFVTPSAVIPLVEFGDLIEDEIRPSVKQATSEFGYAGGAWGGMQAEGKATTTVSFVVWRTSSGIASVRDDILLSASTFPALSTGVLRMAVQGGATWEMRDAVLSTFEITPDVAWPDGFSSRRSYAATGGQLLPITPLPLTQGLPWNFILQTWDELGTVLWDDL